MRLKEFCVFKATGWVHAEFERYNTNLEREKDRSQKSLELVATSTSNLML